MTVNKKPSESTNSNKSEIQTKKTQEAIQLTKKIEKILGSHQTSYEKKVALFNVVKTLEVGETDPSKKERMNYLLQSRFYHELAKQSMKEYKKTTVGEFSKT